MKKVSFTSFPLWMAMSLKVSLAFLFLLSAGRLHSQEISLVSIPAKSIIPATASKDDGKMRYSLLATQLASDSNMLNLKDPGKKLKCTIEKTDSIFHLPDGDSRALLCALPEYTGEYRLVVKSVLGFFQSKHEYFAPTLLFLDASFQPVFGWHFRNFRIVPGTPNTAIHLESEIPIDEERSRCAYVLIFTRNVDQLIGKGYQSNYSSFPGSSSYVCNIYSSTTGHLVLERHAR